MDFGKLTNLHTISLAGNKLTSLPKSISGLVNLRDLGLQGNELTEVPAEIGALSESNTLHCITVADIVVFESLSSCNTLCLATLCLAVQWCAMLCLLCHAVPCYATICRAIYPSLCHALHFRAVCNALLFDAQSICCVTARAFACITCFIMHILLSYKTSAWASTNRLLRLHMQTVL